MPISNSLRYVNNYTIYVFKAVKTKNTKNYVSIKLNNHKDLKVFFQVRWMMYWIVYAIFAAFESILDPILYFW